MARGPDGGASTAQLSRTGLTALAALVVTRATVSFEFQSVTALLPVLERSFALTPSQFGIMLGIYMAPGVATTILTPYLVNRIGRASLLYASLGLMAVGQVALLQASSVEWAYASRFLAGFGGCTIYGAAIALVADLKNSGSIAFRMGMIAASWPFGNALALLLLGSLASPTGLLVGQAPVFGVVLSAVLIPIALRTMSADGAVSKECFGRAPASGTGLGLRDWGIALGGVLQVSLCFALYNVGFIVLTSFSPSVLEALGLTRSSASAVASVPMWVFILSVPLGGVIAARLGRKDSALMVFGCLGAAACFVLIPLVEERWTLFVIAGLVGGLPTAPILARVSETTRNVAAKELSYAAFFFVFFVTLLAVPPLIGRMIELTASPFAAVYLAAAMLALSVILYLPFHRGGPES